MRIGFAGLTHGHVWHIMDRFAAAPGVELAAVADATPLLDKARERFGRAYTDWREMLDGEKLDGLVVTSDNLESSNIVVEALGRGIPCMKEKPMAANVEDAQRMLEAWEESGVPLMINWPFVWSPWVHELKKYVDDETYGHVYHLRYRNGHWGPREINCDEYFVGWLYDEKKNGGGAIADFCSYGAVLCRWYFGMPESVYAVRGNFTKDYDVSDDHAVCVLKYPKGSAVIEGTWALFGFDQSANPVLHAKRGTVGVYEDEVRLHIPGQEPVPTTPSSLPGPDMANYFLHLVEHNREPEGMLSPRLSADASRIIEAAKKSGRTGCAERP